MSEYKKWTEENPVTDELLLEHWEGFIGYISSVASRTYKLSEEDREDILADIKLRLLGIPADKRMFEGYTKIVINNAVRDGIKSIVSHGATPGNNWKGYRFSTLDFHTAAPTNHNRSGDEPSEDEMDRVVPPFMGLESILVDRFTLVKAIKTLKPNQKRVVELYYGEDLSALVVAHRMGMSEENVRLLIKKAIRKLNKALSG